MSRVEQYWIPHFDLRTGEKGLTEFAGTDHGSKLRYRELTTQYAGTREVGLPFRADSRVDALRRLEKLWPGRKPISDD
jgi:hypothetical protein